MLSSEKEKYLTPISSSVTRLSSLLYVPALNLPKASGTHTHPRGGAISRRLCYGRLHHLKKEWRVDVISRKCNVLALQLANSGVLCQLGVASS